jgi:putative sterol carrier protein
MAIPFASDEWVKALETALNNSKGYQTAAQKWEGDLCLLVKAGAGMASDTHLYLDLWHGACRQAYVSQEPVKAEFTIAAPLPTWKQVVDGKLDPIRGLTSGRLKLSGPMLKILKAPKAAIELVNCAKTIETEWPA